MVQSIWFGQIIDVKTSWQLGPSHGFGWLDGEIRDQIAPLLPGGDPAHSSPRRAMAF